MRLSGSPAFRFEGAWWSSQIETEATKWSGSDQNLVTDLAGIRRQPAWAERFPRLFGNRARYQIVVKPGVSGGIDFASRL